MIRKFFVAMTGTIFVALLMLHASAVPCGAQTSEDILTVNTKAFLCIPDVREFEAHWDKTQLGQLAADPVMKPFANDLQLQIRDRLIQSNLNIQVDWEEIQAACGKELAFASVLPDSGEGQAAVLIMDVTGREKEAEAMTQSFATKLKEREAVRSTMDVSGTTMVIHKLPRERGKLKSDTVVQFTHGDHMVITNHVKVSQELVMRMASGKFDENLASLPTFQKTVLRSEAEDSSLSAHVRWYVEPFGFVRMLKSSQIDIDRGAHDYLQMMAEQGFDAVQSAGGVVHFATDEHEMLHRSFIFAPTTDGAEAGEKYKLAARMLDFPNDSAWDVPNWIPRELATHMSLRWKTREAFEHVRSIVDAMAGNPGDDKPKRSYFEDFLDSMKNDKHGPQLDIRNGFIAHLDDQLHVFTDQVLPVTTASERLLVAIKLTNPAAVSKTLRKLKGDKEFKLHKFGEYDVWEFTSAQDDVLPPEAILDDLGIVTEDAEEEFDDDAKPIGLANTSFTVAHDHLLISTHMSQLKEIINTKPNADSLGTAADFKRIQRKLVDIGAGSDSFRFFARTDEEYRTNYELLRKGKMPESESFLGRVLNRILGERNRDVVRAQRVDGKNLPEFQTVRSYFGPSGLFVRSENEGWLISGLLLSKHNDRQL